MKNKIKRIIILTTLVFAPLLAFASGGKETFPNESFSPNLSDKESLQRGAKLYVNYCLACHSLKYQRYNRIGKDTGLDDKTIKKNLIFTGQPVGAHMNTSMSADLAEKWFGVAPPDLSLTSRARGKDFIYNYLKGFYVDKKSLFGVNNSLFPNVSMPHVLSDLEGTKEPSYHTEGKVKTINGFKQLTKGSISENEYEEVVSDLSNFLYYVSDPSRIQRSRIGWKILLFLVLMTGIFYALKKEMWKDLH